MAYSSAKKKEQFLPKTFKEEQAEKVLPSDSSLLEKADEAVENASAPYVTLSKRKVSDKRQIMLGYDRFVFPFEPGEDLLISTVVDTAQQKVFIVKRPDGRVYYGRLIKESLKVQTKPQGARLEKLAEIAAQPEAREKTLRELQLSPQVFGQAQLSFALASYLEQRQNLKISRKALEAAQTAITDLDALSQIKGQNFDEQKKKILDSLVAPDLEDFQNQALEFLRVKGFVEFGPNHEIIIDTNKIQQGFGGEGLTKPLQKKITAPFLDRGTVWALHYIFKNRPVISKQDWEKGRKEPKPLFYEPANVSATFDRKQIRNADFYLLYTGKWAQNVIDSNYPTAAEHDIKFGEGLIPLLIFHPKYGDGYQDENNRLMVKYKDGSYRPITSEWFTKDMSFGGGQLEGGKFGDKKIPALNSPRIYLENFTPKLLEYGVLKLTDFRMRSDSNTARQQRWVEEGVASRGYRMIGKIRYYIGRQFENDPTVRVHQLSDQFGGVTKVDGQGNEKLTHIFNLTTLNDPRLKSDSKGYWRTTIEVTQTRPYDSANFNKQLPEESLEAYQTRLKTVDNFNNLLAISKELSQKTGINIMHLNFREQQWLSAAYGTDIFKNNKEEIVDFARKYSREGLRAFLSLEHDQKMGGKILEIGRKLAPEEARHFFTDYAAVVDFANVFDTKLSLEFERRLGGKFNREAHYAHLLRRAKDYLQKIHELAADSRWQLTYAQATKKLQEEAPYLQVDLCHRVVLEETAIALANNFGVEKIRDILNQTKVPEADAILEFINPEVSAEILRDLKELYKRIRFEEYKINEQMTGADLEYLRQHLPEGGVKILDLGCGTGRHLKPLTASGYQVDGLDYVERHVELARAAVPTAKVVQGDWIVTPFADGSYQAVYSLGRNILHEFQPHVQHNLFKEVNRLLPIGGKFIFDIPDRDKGNYAALVNGYSRKLHERNITNFRYGTIYDSPDGQNFFTRYAYSRQDITALATANGFEIEFTQEAPLATNNGDVNIYYTLRKVVDIK